MFNEKYKSVNDKIEPSKSTQRRVLGLISSPPKSGGVPVKRIVALAASVAVVITSLVIVSSNRGANPLGVYISQKTETGSKASETESTSSKKTKKTEKKKVDKTAAKTSEKTDTATPPADNVLKKNDEYYNPSYDEIYNSVKKFKQDTDISFVKNYGVATVKAKSANMPLDDVAETTADYSKTNTQKSDVDEGDIIKTNGKYIFVLNDGNCINIVKPAGKKTEFVTKIKSSDNLNILQIYVTDTRLVVIANKYGRKNAKTDSTDSIYPYYSHNATVLCYDITDIKNPKKVGENSQSGSFEESRLVGDTLYVVSVYNTVFWDDFKKSDPLTYCPYTENKNGKKTVLEAKCIRIASSPRSCGYSVICSYAINSGKILSKNALFCGAGDLYMDTENLVIASNVDVNSKSATVTNKTQLTLYNVKDRKLKYAAAAIVKGKLLNQFSMDVYDGYLRVVTTVNQYTDDGVDTTNSLYVLDGDLNKVGSIVGLAKDERVYSVRFDKTVGYFVTYRETDPLFCVDLSDPDSPKILSALKIPGFSEYLHPFGKGRLLGFGKQAEGNITTDYKLSMFDTSDLTDVTERTKMLLSKGDSYSEAEYNHKAIFVDVEKGLIGIPFDDTYCVYKYTESDGFKCIKECSMGGYGYENIRSMYIGDNFYICNSEKIYVFDYSDFTKLKTLKLTTD